jgi:hypothetical protein
MQKINTFKSSEIICFRRSNHFFSFIDYLVYIHDWYGQLTTNSLIFDGLSEFGLEIGQKCAFLKNVKKSIFSTILKKTAKTGLSDSAFFYVIGSNLLIYEQKFIKKVVGCFDIILFYFR